MKGLHELTWAYNRISLRWFSSIYFPDAFIMLVFCLYNKLFTMSTYYFFIFGFLFNIYYQTSKRGVAEFEKIFNVYILLYWTICSASMADGSIMPFYYVFILYINNSTFRNRICYDFWTHTLHIYTILREWNQKNKCE